ARRMGAHGARMTGGGFGGSIIAMVDKGESRHVAEAIAQEFATRGFRQPQYLTAVASAAGCRED
ncbi:MAG: galactokinase, partial [Bifidobacterium minimum]|nr:galactokinase [Bifidobacterium minimum]